MNFFEFLVLLVNLFVDFRRVFILVLNCRFFFLSKLIFCIVDFVFNIFFWDIFIFFCFFRCERYFCWVLVEDIRSFFFEICILGRFLIDLIWLRIIFWGMKDRFLRFLIVIFLFIEKFFLIVVCLWDISSNNLIIFYIWIGCLLFVMCL